MYLKRACLTTPQQGKYILGYMSFLVATGLCEEVVLSFLPVGHTHLDIDQFFGCVARHLRTTVAWCRDMLLQKVRKAYKARWHSKPPITGNMEEVANFSDWIAPYLNPTEKTQSRSGVTKFHQFRVRANDDRTNVNLQVKEWSSGKEEWRGLDESTTHHEVFKRVPTLQDLRTGCPPSQRKPFDVDLLAKWYKATAKSINKMCDARNVDDESRADLMACMDLIKDRSPLPLAWNLDVYDSRPDRAFAKQVL